MKNKNLKIIGLFFLFFLFDVIRPLGYLFLPNLTFLAIVSIALYSNLNLSLLIALFAGSFLDSLIFSGNLFYTPVYPLFVLFVFFLNRFLYFMKIKNSPSTVKILLSISAILLYSLFHNLIAKETNLLFLISFFIQSCLSFVFVDRLIQKALPRKYSTFSLKR